MKYLQRFFENTRLPILDMVIDDDGDLYAMALEKGVNKGHIEYAKGEVITRIVGDDGKDYTSGIDKNGNIKWVEGYKDDEGFILNSRKERMVIPNNVRDKYGISPLVLTDIYWKDENIKLTNPDYPKIYNPLPTGWVNIKVDMELLKRVKRYSANLTRKDKSNDKGTEQSWSDFKSKLIALETTSTKSKFYSNLKNKDSIQREMGVVILLRYINEIKDYFNASQSGFLFESFLAGLIPGAIVVDDNGKSDITANGKKYQIKLYREGGYIDILSESKRKKLTSKEGKYSKYTNRDLFIKNELKTSLSDYYVVCIKHIDKIVIYLYTMTSEKNDNYLLDHVSEKWYIGPQTLNGSPEKYTIKILDIEKTIKRISEKLRDSVKNMYNELSDFQYNLETILTGVNEEGKVIESEEYDEVSEKSKSNLSKLKKILDNMLTNMKEGWNRNRKSKK